MKKLLLTALTAMLVSFGAAADSTQVNFSSNVASYCTVGSIMPGVMHVSGTSVTTDQAAIIAVNNNEANAYKVNLTNPAGFATSPASFSGTATLATQFAISGPNETTSDVTNEQFHNLVNSGSDTMSVSVNGTTDVDTTAGDYSAVAVVSCIAI